MRGAHGGFKVFGNFGGAQHVERGLRGAAFAGDALAQGGEGVALFRGLLRQQRAAFKGADGESPRLFARQAKAFASALHGFQKVEDVGGTVSETFEATQDPIDKFTMALNGVKLRTGSGLAGHFRAIVFSPAHLTLVKDGPEERRRFLDGAIGQLWPKYDSLYAAYLRAVSQRNALLKDARFHTQLLDMLEVYDREIARKGARLVDYRLRYLARLTPYAEEIYAGIAGGKETLGLSYDGLPDGREEAAQLAALKAARKEDLAAAVTSVGPHRDALALTVSGMDARQFASQGQQRSAVLALKLAEAAVLRDIAGEQPVALLDDVMSELDETRQDYLLRHIRGWQVFLTGCDGGIVRRMTTGAVFRMESGALTKEG